MSSEKVCWGWGDHQRNRNFKLLIKHQGSEHSMGSWESGRRWQLKGQLKEKRSRAWLHCCSAEEQTERQGWRTPPWGLHWGKNMPHTSLRNGSKHASSISTWRKKGVCEVDCCACRAKRNYIRQFACVCATQFLKLIQQEQENTGNSGKWWIPGTAAGVWQLLSDQRWTARCLGMRWGCSWALDTSPPLWTHRMKLRAWRK